MIIAAKLLNQIYKEDLFMKKILMLVCAFIFVATVAFAAGPKTYQVTGPVLEVKADTIVVQKGKDKWEISRDAATKVTGDLKVGSKVTIEYTMKAATIEVKDAKKADAKKKK
jgi:hypothetical protein